VHVKHGLTNVLGTVVDETELAWALAEVARSVLNAVERNDVCIAIGVDETFSAICFLMATLARKRLPLPSDLAVSCTTWLDTYAGHHDEPRLRDLIGQVKIDSRDSSRYDRHR
jgi:hypothetical protein